MALVTNNISGSSASSRIGITGSVIFANQPGPQFPPMPGTDVTFFVSGSSTERSVFGGTTVVSGTLFVDGDTYIGDAGTDKLIISASTSLVGDLFEITGSLVVTGGISGSLTRLTNGTSYLVAGDNISIVSSSGGSISIGTTTSITSSFSGSYSTTTRSFTGAGPFTAPLKGFILAEVNADPTTVYLPASAPDGFQVTVKRNDASPNSNSLWVSGSNSDGIDGSLGTKIDSNWGATTFVKLGSTWYTT